MVCQYCNRNLLNCVPFPVLSIKVVQFGINENGKLCPFMKLWFWEQHCGQYSVDGRDSHERKGLLINCCTIYQLLTRHSLEKFYCRAYTWEIRRVWPWRFMLVSFISLSSLSFVFLRLPSVYNLDFTPSVIMSSVSIRSSSALRKFVLVLLYMV